MGSPGSRVRCFRTCTRSQTAQGPNAPRYCGSPGIAFRRGNNVSTLKLSDISRLNTRPARTFVNASPKPLQIPAHDSRPVWIATPSPYDSFIHDILPVLTGASATIWNPTDRMPVFLCAMDILTCLREKAHRTKEKPAILMGSGFYI